MNRLMWANVATQANVKLLAQRGVKILGPGLGEQACGETGAGRMLEPNEIVRELVRSSSGYLQGLKVVVTAGPTRECIDPVRFITNRSSGKMGFAVAQAARDAGAAEVVIISGPVNVATPRGVRVESRAGVEMNLLLDDLGPIAPSRFADALSAGTGTTATRLLWGAAAIGGAAVFDRAASSYADEHRSEPSLKVLRQVGSTLPYVGLGVAGAMWLAPDGPRDRSVAEASIEAGVTAVALAEVSKQVVDRSRPSDGRGAADFGHDRRSASSFPSVHTALAWAVVTPLAQRYDAPWLYGVAALTNAARVTERKHWLSDTVAGSVLGYVVGDWFARRADGSTSVVLVPHGVVVSSTFR